MAARTSRQARPKLKLRGRISRVETARRKVQSYGGETGGELKITLEVERPEAPKRPDAWRVREWLTKKQQTSWSPAEVQAHIETLEGDDHKRAREMLGEYLTDLEAYERQREGMVAELQGFVRTAALGIALEGEAVTVELSPDVEAVRQLLPGMSALEAPDDGS